ncbi:MAG: tetratricopeptide repeat protein, partial [Acidobacteriota bacterium]
DVAITAVNLASLLNERKLLDEAPALARQALENLRKSKPGHWRIAHAESVLGGSLAAVGDYARAEALLLRSYPIRKASHDACSRYNRDAMQRLVQLYETWGKPEVAQSYRKPLEDCLSMRQPA